MFKKLKISYVTGKIIAFFAMTAVVVVSNQACFLIYHQPKAPQIKNN